ncbi:glycosyltransferase [Bacillaceae bacterium IKA-2]|nr:glycosyltransferase [Bacillaceae bacterium IKA-2]
MPLLTIVVPIYNVEDYIPDCIESILTQTLKIYIK